MCAKLLILESPGKVKKVQEILGPGWKVAASVGHVRDLPVKEMGVAAPDFTPQYIPTDRGKDVLSRLVGMVKNAEEVFLATDPDREGEAIAWHLQEALKLKNAKRVTYTEITEAAIRAALSNTRSIDMALVAAQEGRRVLDRFCGYMVSGPLSNATGEKLSAGRVQSPAVRLVVDREKEIKSFSSTTHYGAELTFENVDNITDGWKAILLVKPWLRECPTESGADQHLDGGQEYLLDKSLPEKAAALRTLDILDCKDSESRAAPPAPFTTSTLQQVASSSLKFGPKQTMQLAQRLYEQGAITYMRTDSPNLSQEATQAIRAYCETQGWPLVETPRKWKSKEGAQEAHEAIRPTHIEIEDAGETEDEKALYRLIRELEKRGIGRPSTYAAIIDTIVSRGYVELSGRTGSAPAAQRSRQKSKPEFTSGAALSAKASAPQDVGPSGIDTAKRFLVLTALGEKVVSGLCGHFAFIEYDFTRTMEQSLDDIAEGKAEYRAVIGSAHEQLYREVQDFAKATGKVCEKCGKPMIHRVKKPDKDGPDKSKKGGYDFWGCPGWPECK